MNYWRRWRRFWRKKLIAQFGGKCQACGWRVRLEFAHKHGGSSTLTGHGRGSVRRLTDVKTKPHSYLLLCHDCHGKYDDGTLEVR